MQGVVPVGGSSQKLLQQMRLQDDDNDDNEGDLMEMEVSGSGEATTILLSSSCPSSSSHPLSMAATAGTASSAGFVDASMIHTDANSSTHGVLVDTSGGGIAFGHGKVSHRKKLHHLTSSSSSSSSSSVMTGDEHTQENVDREEDRHNHYTRWMSRDRDRDRNASLGHRTVSRSQTRAQHNHHNHDQHEETVVVRFSVECPVTEENFSTLGVSSPIGGEDGNSPLNNSIHHLDDTIPFPASASKNARQCKSFDADDDDELAMGGGSAEEGSRGKLAVSGTGTGTSNKRKRSHHTTHTNDNSSSGCHVDGLMEGGEGGSGGLNTAKTLHGTQQHPQHHQLEDSRDHQSDRDRSARLDGSSMTTLLDQSLDMGMDHQGGLSTSGLGSTGMSMNDGVNTTHDLRGGNHHHHHNNNHNSNHKSTKLHGSTAQNNHNKITTDLGKCPAKVVPSSEVFEPTTSTAISASVKRRRA